MSTKLAVLALTSMCWIGCGSAVPDPGGGGGGSADPGAVQRCAELCGPAAPGSSFSDPECLSACIAVADVSDVQGFVLAGAEAVVNIRETYRFRPAWDEERDQLLTICQFFESEDGSTAALTNFPLAVPRQTADFFSFSRVSDTIIWGLYDKSSEEEWSGVPGGEVSVDCRVTSIGGGVTTCRVGWTGSANGRISRETVASTVRISCTFLDAAVAIDVGSCFAMGCDDSNDCTDDWCTPDCKHVPRAGAECELDGAAGVCVQGECAQSPCGQSCYDGDVCTIDSCNFEQEMCDHAPLDSEDCVLVSNED